GGFNRRIEYYTEPSPTSIAIGDLDGTGRMGLVIPSSGGNIRIEDSFGDGTFGNGGTYTTGSGPQDVVVADFDNDCDPDFAVACSSANTAVTYVNEGNGLFN